MENRKGSGIFLGVVGVATLVVAIIGATFAYFSATATAEGNITGSTLDTSGASMSVTATKETFEGATANNNLVPTNITSETYGLALTNKCEATPGTGTAKYTGCHVYTIATENTTAGNYTLTVDLSVDAQVKTDWSYIVYTSTAFNAAGTVVTSGTFGTGNTTTVTIDNGTTALAAETEKTYYLMIYLADDNDVQNATDGDKASNSATGTYTGTVTFAALGGGQVKATFTA